jgi:hypothetical protein
MSTDSSDTDGGLLSRGHEITRQVAWLSRYEGLSLEAAIDLAQAEGRRVRVIHPGDIITLEFNTQRLNLDLDDAGALVRIHAG